MRPSTSRRPLPRCRPAGKENRRSSPRTAGSTIMYAEGEILVREEIPRPRTGDPRAPPSARLEQAGQDPDPRVIDGVPRSDRARPDSHRARRARGDRPGARPGNRHAESRPDRRAGHGQRLPGHRTRGGVRRDRALSLGLPGNGGAGVLIYMADTGLLQDAARRPIRGWPAFRWGIRPRMRTPFPTPGNPPVIPRLRRSRHVRRGCYAVHGTRRGDHHDQRPLVGGQSCWNRIWCPGSKRRSASAWTSST